VTPFAIAADVASDDRPGTTYRTIHSEVRVCGTCRNRERTARMQEYFDLTQLVVRSVPGAVGVSDLHGHETDSRGEAAERNFDPPRRVMVKRRREVQPAHPNTNHD
jgi:hypothetical protein